MSRLRGAIVLGLLALAGVLLTACGTSAPPQDLNPPILTNFDALPKQLATVVFTPTPTPVLIGGTVVPVAQPTATAAPPTLTPTLTPYVGVFLGEPTSESGEPAPTLAPYVVAPVAGGAVGVAPALGTGSGCTIPVASTFANAYTAVQDRLGCPVSAGVTVSPMAVQPFERGWMYWRGDTRQIYALAANGQYWQMADTWNEGMPADDPAYSPPPGLVQPVRGFGLAWRSTPPLRDALGWGTAPEAPFSGFWQDFERGAMLLGSDGHVYALFSAEGQHSGPLPP